MFTIAQRILQSFRVQDYSVLKSRLQLCHHQPRQKKSALCNISLTTLPESSLSLLHVAPMDARNAALSPFGEREIGKAASDFLASGSERRKRGRPPTSSFNAEQVRPKPDQGKPQAVILEDARKSATDLMRDSPSYRKLVRTEEALDVAIMRKQQGIKESLRAEDHTESRVFRLYLFNTYRSQPGGDGVTSEDVPSWSLRIQGHLLPKEEEQADERGRGGAGGAEVPANHGMAEGGGGGSQSQGGVPPLHTPLPGAMDAHAHDQRFPSGQNPAAVSGGQGAGTGASSILTSAPKCSDIFRRIVIELDKEHYPENNLIEWKRNDKDKSSDGFEISRGGSKEFTAKIFLYVDHSPERFKLSPELSRLIGATTDTQKGVFAGLWQYVRKMRLQCVDDRTAVRLDSGLKTLLGPANANVEVLKLQQLFAVVKSHMGAPEPLVVEYQVMLSGDVVDNQDCYDLQVSVQDTSLIEAARQAGVFGLTLPHSPEFDALNQKHMLALQKIAHHKKRRDFFEGFCANPVQFINHLILSQTRDLKVLGGSTGRNPEEERRSAFYQQQWVHEAVPRYLLRKAIADTAEDTVESSLK